MTVPAGSPGDDVPEADWAEQEADAGRSEDETPVVVPSTETGFREANEADLLEQEVAVDYGDDEA